MLHHSNNNNNKPYTLNYKLENIIMKILERKQTCLHFVDVKVEVRASLDINTTYISFDNTDDTNKIYDILSNHQAFDGNYNIVTIKYHNTKALTGEIVVKYHKNILSINIYNNWEEL